MTDRGRGMHDRPFRFRANYGKPEVPDFRWIFLSARGCGSCRLTQKRWHTRRLSGGMTSANACGFILLSVLMVLAPLLSPDWFPPTGFDGLNGRALWLMVMSAVQSGVGFTYLTIRWVLPAAQRLAAFRPQLPQLQPQGRGSMLPEGATQGSVV